MTFAGFDRFYTTSEPERTRALGELGYRDEGVACWVHLEQVSGSIPLYRLRNTSNDAHFYTTSLNEHDEVIAAGMYASEGITCFVFPHGSADTSPFHRLYSVHNGDHLYTTNDAESERAINDLHYQYEGVACHVLFSRVVGAVPLYRLWREPTSKAMDPQDRRSLIRRHVTMKWQSTHITFRDDVKRMLEQSDGDRDSVRRICLSWGIIPAIVDDWLAVLDGDEDTAAIYVSDGQQAAYHVDDEGNESRNNVPYATILEARIKRSQERRAQAVQRVGERFASDVTYLMDSMLLGYSEKEIADTVPGWEKSYLEVSLSCARRNRIRRHVELEALKAAGPFVVADSIRGAGRDIRRGLEELGDTIGQGLDKLSVSVFAGLKSVAESNLQVARSLDNVAAAEGRVADAIRSVAEPLAGIASASNRYVDLQEHVQREAERAKMRPVLSGRMLLVNTRDGSSAIVTGTAHRRDNCYILARISDLDMVLLAIQSVVTP